MLKKLSIKKICFSFFLSSLALLLGLSLNVNSAKAELLLNFLNYADINDGFAVGHNSTNLGFSLYPNESLTIDDFSFMARRFGSPSSPLYLKVYTYDGTATTSMQLVATSSVVLSSSLPTSGMATTSFSFSSLVLSASQYYFFEFNTDTISGSNNYIVFANTSVPMSPYNLKVFYKPPDYAYALNTISNWWIPFLLNGAQYIPPPPLTGQTFWAGVGQQYGQVGSDWSVPAYYNVCSNYNDLQDLKITFFDDYLSTGDITKTIFDRTNQPILPCSGYVQLSGPVVESSAFTSTSSYLQLWTTADGVLATSSFFTSIVSASSSDYLEIFSPNNRQRFTSIPNDIFFQINYTNQQGNYNSLRLSLYSLEKRLTENFTYSLETSVSSVIFPVLSNIEDGNYYITANMYHTDSSSTFPSVNNVQIVVGTTTQFQEFVQVSTSTPNVDFCSSDEWATPSPSLNFGFGSVELDFLNLTKIKCNVFAGLSDFYDWTADKMSNFLTYSKLALGVVFPFNIPIQFYSSWQDSGQSGVYPNALSYFDIVDNNGDIKIDLPAEMNGTGASQSVIVFGSSIFTNVPALSAFFAGIKALSTYLLWALFIFYIYSLADSIYQESKSLNE